MRTLISFTQKHILWVMFGALWLYLFVAGVRSYQGSDVVYIAFSIVFLLLLVSGFHTRRTYVYTYLVVLLWLGFWLKVSYHLTLPYHPYVEPTGQFVGSAANWDEVLLVAIATAIGVLISRAVFQRLPGNRQSVLGYKKYIPRWLSVYNKWHLVLFSLVLIATGLANIYFGIFVVGYGVRTILIWPLNALITLMIVGGGFVVWVASILWWRLIPGRAIFLTVIILLVAATLLTFSTLSRGVVVFFALPLLYALYTNRKMIADYSILKSSLIVSFFLITVISSFFAVNMIRNNSYFKESYRATQISPDFSIDQGFTKARALLNFSVDRWIGVEGVMAVSSYPGIGMDLLLKGILEKPELGTPTIYQRICPWPSSPQFDAIEENVRLFSLPGGTAFLYYSGSLLVVFVSVVVISLLLQFTETIIFSLTSNPILCSGVGWLMAILFAHFGGTPRYTITPVLVFLFISICFIGVIQSRWVEKTLFTRSRQEHS